MTLPEETRQKVENLVIININLDNLQGMSLSQSFFL